MKRGKKGQARGKALPGPASHKMIQEPKEKKGEPRPRN